MKKRRIIAVNRDTGERMVFDSTYQAAMSLGTSTQNLLLALDRGGSCKGWKVYDSPDTIRGRIEDLQKQLAEVERIL